MIATEHHSTDLPFAEAHRTYEFRAPYAPQALAYVRDVFSARQSSRAWI